ncbi:Methyltransferase-like protein 16 [Liparis tanakae]|uniref:Methyltransferase-like protein 16 n=1 Tax=Liparis tanakae TaxID=230148 RepID=A0A4Z2EZR5_9TELE|nr:Methyltransferase-like protein 16 [Liparis tanakae]
MTPRRLLLQVLHKRVPSRKHELSLFLTATENTWIHGRQKRREGSRQLRELPRAPRADTRTAAAATPAPENRSDGGGGASNETTSAEQIENGAAPSNETGEDGEKEVSEKAPGEDVDMACSARAGEETALRETPAAAASEAAPSERPPGERFLLKCLLNVALEEGDVALEMHWVEGQNKDLMNQLCTYLKNTLLRCVAKP